MISFDPHDTSQRWNWVRIFTTIMCVKCQKFINIYRDLGWKSVCTFACSKRRKHLIISYGILKKHLQLYKMTSNDDLLYHFNFFLTFHSYLESHTDSRVQTEQNGTPHRQEPACSCGSTAPDTWERKEHVLCHVGCMALLSRVSTSLSGL